MEQEEREHMEHLTNISTRNAFTTELTYSGDTTPIISRNHPQCCPVPTTTLSDGNDAFTILCEAIGSTPREMVCKLLKTRSDEIQSQFLDKRDEILPLLKDQYPLVNPSASGFTEWYIQNKYEPFVRSRMPKILFSISSHTRENAPIHILFTFNFIIPENADPVIGYEDVQEYCSHLMCKMVTNHLRLQSVLAASVEIPVKRPEAKPLPTFDWLAPEEQLYDLYLKLSENKYISCSYEIFKGIFNKGDFTVPVVWLGSQRELIALIKFLQEKDFLEKPGQQNWVLIASMFSKHNDERFNTNSLSSESSWVNLDSLSKPQKSLIEKVSSIL